ncbi:MAG: sigma-70 family RNA polymerase sigma factor [Chitinophagales bacterium]|nr:sigma-70 family RNA polymerase sigma factor [Chitinophagales bacterium]
MELTDGEILRLFRDPEQKKKGFSLLVKKYQKPLYWHIRRMVSQHEDANDVIQNTFLKAWQGLDNFRSDAQLYTWLYRIATNESINFLNKEKKHLAIDIDDAPNAQYMESSSSPDGDLLKIKLTSAIERLPEKQRAVFSLRYFEEMKYEEMSVVMETSVGALKASYFHAVKKIEDYILGN